MEAALAAAKAKQPTQHYKRAHKEAVRGVIAAKRDISYDQLALDLRRAQTTKLEEYAARRLTALIEAEETLAADTAKFDNFLKRNGEEVQAAVEAAELQTRIRQDKTLEVKSLHAVLAGIKGEVNKLEDALEECLVYRQFLDDLTPQDWLQEVREARAAAKSVRVQAWQEQCAAVLAERSAAAEAVAAQEDAKANARSQQQYDRAVVALGAAQERAQIAQAAQEPAIEADPPEELAEPNYFTEPSKLTQELHKIEAGNAEIRAQLQSEQDARAAAAKAGAEAIAKLTDKADGLGIEAARLQAEALVARRSSKRASATPAVNSGNLQRLSGIRDMKSSRHLAKVSSRKSATGGTNGTAPSRSPEAGSIVSPRYTSRTLNSSKSGSFRK